MLLGKKFEYGRRLYNFKIEKGGGTEFIELEGLPTLYNFIDSNYNGLI